MRPSISGPNSTPLPSSCGRSDASPLAPPTARWARRECGAVSPAGRFTRHPCPVFLLPSRRTSAARKRAARIPPEPARRRPAPPHPPPPRTAPVAQTSKSAVSRVSKPAGRPHPQRLALPHASETALPLPIWKSAIQQVGKPALRTAARGCAPCAHGRILVSCNDAARF